MCRTCCCSPDLLFDNWQLTARKWSLRTQCLYDGMKRSSSGESPGSADAKRQATSLAQSSEAAAAEVRRRSDPHRMASPGYPVCLAPVSPAPSFSCPECQRAVSAASYQTHGLTAMPCFPLPTTSCAGPCQEGMRRAAGQSPSSRAAWQRPAGSSSRAGSWAIRKTQCRRDNC